MEDAKEEATREEAIQEEFTCVICLQEVNIPVFFTCFPCYGRNTPLRTCELSMPCGVYTRVCISCGEIYLELTKPVSSRTKKKKCLFCPMECRLENLHRNNAYCIDYLWIREHDSLQRCWECPWCPQRGGEGISSKSRMNLLHHLQKDCPHFHTLCECGMVVKRCDWESHHQICPYYVLCEQCQRCFPKSEMMLHQSEVHQKTQCSLCRQYVPIHNFLHHIFQSCLAPDSCPLCEQQVQRCTIHQHIRQRHLLSLSSSPSVTTTVIEPTTPPIRPDSPEDSHEDIPEDIPAISYTPVRPFRRERETIEETIAMMAEEMIVLMEEESIEDSFFEVEEEFEEELEEEKDGF